MTNNYSSIVDKLHLYSRKYWLFRFIKGLLLLITGLTFLITVVLCIEYLFYTPPYLKISFAVCLIAVFLLLFYKYILTPLSYLTRFRKFGVLSQAKLVSEHFPELKDHLINVVELGEFNGDSQLVLKSIEQKISQLPRFDFTLYFNLKLISRVVLAFLVVVIVSLILSLTFPGFFIQAGYRFIHLSEQFVKPAPFEFVVNNSSLKVLKGGALKLSVSCVGSELPENVYVNIGGQNFVMEKEDGTFIYSLNNVQNSFSLFFTDLQFVSSRYDIVVVPDPLILSYKVKVSPPAYTQLPLKDYEDITNIQAPYGSKIEWEFECSDADSLFVNFEGERIEGIIGNDLQFLISSMLTKSGTYDVYLKNEYVGPKKVISFGVELTPDDFPTINVVQLQDSTNLMQFYFKGQIGDDYGFHRLVFNLRNIENDSVFVLRILPNVLQQDFYYAVDFKSFRKLGDDFSYYFTVSDNDSFHKFKKSTSEVFNFRFPDYEDVNRTTNKMFDDIETLVNHTKDIVEDIKQDLEEFKYRSISENFNEWDEQQFMQQILNKKDEVQRAINQLINKNFQMNNLKNSFEDQREEMLEKQQQIDELLNELMTDELKQLFDEFNELAKQFDQERFNELMNRMEFPMEDFSKQLDRNLELLKRYKIEQNLESIISEIDKVAENELDNLEELENSNWESVMKSETSNQDRVEELSQQLNELRRSNEELDKPMNLYPLDDEFKDVDNNYEEIKESVKGKRKRKSKEEISDNHQQLLNLSFSLQQMLGNSQVSQAGENIENLKQILKNLVFLSFRQEEILNLANNLSVNDPSLRQVQLSQELLGLQTKQVEDSLYALATRTPAISSKVNNELSKIEFSLNTAIDDLKEADFRYVVKYQQNVITGFNELALLLNEALENLEKMMANSMPGDQECDKPGGSGKGSMSKLKNAQQSLKDQLQRMIEEMKNGNQGQLGQQIGKSLMQQEILKQLVNDMMMDQGIGSSAKEQLRAINQLIEQNRLDLLQKKLDNRIVDRQNLILDHLLKAEKAEMERDLDDKRESKTADQNIYSNPELLFEYKEKEKNKDEDLRYNSIRMRKFYEDKYRNYIKKVNQ